MSITDPAADPAAVPADGTVPAPDPVPAPPADQPVVEQPAPAADPEPAPVEPPADQPPVAPVDPTPAPAVTTGPPVEEPAPAPAPEPVGPGITHLHLSTGDRVRVITPDQGIEALSGRGPWIRLVCSDNGLERSFAVAHIVSYE